MAEHASKRKVLNPLTTIASTARSCFSCFPCLRPNLNSSSSPSDSDHFSPHTPTQPHPLAARGVAALTKVREWSEIAAGPKWKNFIRRFNKPHRSHSARFHYDALSYARNFDESSRDLESFDFTNDDDFSQRYPTESSRNIPMIDENVAVS